MLKNQKKPKREIAGKHKNSLTAMCHTVKTTHSINVKHLVKGNVILPVLTQILILYIQNHSHVSHVQHLNLQFIWK